jgi:hypothetical protein
MKTSNILILSTIAFLILSSCAKKSEPKIFNGQFNTEKIIIDPTNDTTLHTLYIRDVTTPVEWGVINGKPPYKIEKAELRSLGIWPTPQNTFKYFSVEFENPQSGRKRIGYLNNVSGGHGQSFVQDQDAKDFFKNKTVDWKVSYSLNNAISDTLKVGINIGFFLTYVEK